MRATFSRGDKVGDAIFPPTHKHCCTSRGNTVPPVEAGARGVGSPPEGWCSPPASTKSIDHRVLQSVTSSSGGNRIRLFFFLLLLLWNQAYNFVIF